MRSTPSDTMPASRRGFLSAVAGVGAAAAFPPSAHGADAAPPGDASASLADAPAEDWRIQHGRIKQAVMGFIFKLPAETLIDAAARMGLVGIEGIGTDAAVLARARDKGLRLLSGGGGVPLETGPVSREFHDEYAARIRAAIDKASAIGSRGIIVFTGNRPAGIRDEQGLENCVEGFQRVASYAAEKQVVLYLEILNSRDDSGWMTGHPGYFGDDADRCAEIVRRVDSPALRLLFDIYHVQVMNGDVIRRIRQYGDLIGHVHTAGVPGRHELDDRQELNYPAVMRALLEIGYRGYVAHEFVPTWPDKLAALRHAARLCDVTA